MLRAWPTVNPCMSAQNPVPRRMAGLAAVIWLFFVEEMTVGPNMNSTVPAAAMKREEDQRESGEKIVNDKRQLIPKIIIS